MYFDQNTVIYHNGKFAKAEEEKVNLYLQTLHYGYGVFEGIRAYETENGVKIFKAEEHFERLKNSCELVNIPYQYNNQELIKISYEILEKNNLKDAYIRPLVYCSPNMSLNRPKEVFLMICAWEWGAYLGNNLLNIMISSYCRPHPKSIKVEAKVCGHYVNSIMATTEAKDNGYDEALMLDFEGFLAEGSGANLFIQKNGKLYTPQLGNILAGITRATVFELCKKLGISIEEGRYEKEFLYDADSAFMCGTAAEIVGINTIDRKKMPLDWENSLGKKLQSEYLNFVKK